MKKSILRKYAHLIAVTGINVQKGQEVFVAAELDQPEFVKMVVEECYRAGAKRVIVDWNYQPLDKLHIRWRSQKNLSTLESWEEARWQHYVKEIPCRIYLVSEDPDGLKGINQEKFAKAQQEKYKVIRPYRDQIENKYQWCIAAVPGAAWAKKLFPKLPKGQAIEKLWEAILAASRVTDDPVQAWKEHNDDLARRCAYLNALGIETLEYRSANGTNFRVGMIEDAEFKGGGETSLLGHYFNPNIPSEEVFISPKRGVAEGIVHSTKPLSYKGQIIENFSIRFENGKAVEVHAEKNEELLKKIVSMDEGAAYLGECALVPFDSPIRNTGILFLETLYDENASCHLALGKGFPEVLEGGYDMGDDELLEAGLNDSAAHVDFMIGTGDLSIDGIRPDGVSVPVFRNGNWAF